MPCIELTLSYIRCAFFFLLWVYVRWMQVNTDRMMKISRMRMIIQKYLIWKKPLISHEVQPIFIKFILLFLSVFFICLYIGFILCCRETQSENERKTYKTCIAWRRTRPILWFVSNKVHNAFHNHYFTWWTGTRERNREKNYDARRVMRQKKCEKK